MPQQSINKRQAPFIAIHRTSYGKKEFNSHPFTSKWEPYSRPLSPTKEKRREDKEQSRIISSFWFHLWLMDLGDGFQWATMESEET
ncbi:hypothetical protein Peur_048687 [Populus x canadensis]